MLESFSECLDGQTFSDWSRLLHTARTQVARKPGDEEDDDDEDDENDKAPSDDDEDDQGYSE
ncbi:MAG: hypothetical protein M3O09_05495 [Acidobacteriota bacterium]|nr:hypothetical protein [Acidobacteriota bacterium]